MTYVKHGKVVTPKRQRAVRKSKEQAVLAYGRLLQRGLGSLSFVQGMKLLEWKKEWFDASKR